MVSQVNERNSQVNFYQPPDDLRAINDQASVILSKIPIDILGEILIQLIPDTDRHSLGQHYTRSDIVDLILGFCIKTPNVTILDPSCGTGSFLLRTYYRLKYLESHKSHQEILNQIWGVERAVIPCLLTRINLASREPSFKEASDRIITEDFFDISPDPFSHIPPIDVVIGNPPFTRQELLGEDYKAKLRNVTIRDYDISLGSQSGIYAHFLVHGASFIGHSNGNRLGYVMLRSFMDVSFGTDLKRFLLSNFKVIAVIESLNERWFEDAQMIPCILILERETAQTKRDEHPVRFVQLKSKIEALFPRIDIKGNGSSSERWRRIDGIVQEIENSTRSSIQDQDSVTFGRVKIEDTEIMRILSIKQKDLLPEEKWGMFLTAPGSFYRILDSNRTNGTIINLGDIANITTGLKSGANEFFYFPNTNFEIKDHNAHKMIIQGRKGLRSLEFEIENEFISPILWKFKFQSEIMITTNDGYCLTVSKSKDELKDEKKKVLKYIEFGEEYPVTKPYSTRPTCQNRITKRGKDWYNIDYRIAAPLLHFEIETNREITFHYRSELKDPIMDKSFMSNYGFYNIIPKNPDDTLIILGILNSTFGMMMIEFGGRYIENRDGTISNQTRVYELKDLPIINPDKIPDNLKIQIRKTMQRLSSRKILVVWDEINQPDRRELDQIIFEEILGLSREEHRELREILANITKSRNVKKNTSLQ
jgi:hypothetical protein